MFAGPVAAAQVTRFSPQGTVKQVRQVSAAFSEPMVAFGDPAAADPFDVTCPVPGQGRWVDTGQWVYDFERDLPAGLRCAFRLRAGLATLGGQTLTGPRDFAFATGGPAIRSSIPREGSEWIDEEQAFVLALDAEPTDESLRRHVGFSRGGNSPARGLSRAHRRGARGHPENAPRRAAPRARACDPGRAALPRSRAGHPGVGQGRRRRERRRH